MDSKLHVWMFFVQTLGCSASREEKAQNGRWKNREKRGGGGYCECCRIKYESVTRVRFMCEVSSTYKKSYSMIDHQTDINA